MQIQIYLPENEHPAAGLVRTVVKDSTDLDTAAFLDSDGHYNDNSARTNINGNPANDGAWHMVPAPFLYYPDPVAACCETHFWKVRVG